jgi:hypothetical protein
MADGRSISPQTLVILAMNNHLLDPIAPTPQLYAYSALFRAIECDFDVY